jgi:hypothetical protein
MAPLKRIKKETLKFQKKRGVTVFAIVRNDCELTLFYLFLGMGL